MTVERPFSSPTSGRLSVIVPAYNEEATIAEIVARLRAVAVALDVIAVRSLGHLRRACSRMRSIEESATA